MKALLRAAIESGYGDDDFMALFPFLRERFAEPTRRRAALTGGEQ